MTFSPLVYLICRLIILAFGLISAAITFLAAVNRYRLSKKRKALFENNLSNHFIRQFNKKELNKFLSSYIVPHCSPSDPANRDGEEYLADIRESLFAYVDRTISSVGKSYQLFLADTGMGKTTFCLNYLAHAKQRFPDLNIALVSLASRACDAHLKGIPNKSDTVLIADALDEDPRGWGRGRERLGEILEICEDFKAVIITCRSQYFMSDDAIPRETPLPILVPRGLNQGQMFTLVRSYISPFSPNEISSYIDRQFPTIFFWRWRKRKRAKELVRTVPDLAHRPMLLERLPEIISDRTISRELFDLYYMLINGWLERESRWISKERLRIISIDLAIKLYQEFRSRRGRLTPDEIRQVAIGRFGESPDWNHLTSRSLLNRDSRGHFKFAHKSIMEFLVVLSACEGSDRALEVEWTDFMKEIFVSWGYTQAGKQHATRAQEMLKSTLGRSSITPLYDSLDAAPTKDRPDFVRCAERRRTAHGNRIAPAAWRGSAIDIHNEDGLGSITISDADYDLSWTYIPPATRDADGFTPSFRMVDALQFLDRGNLFKAPSYEQFISLVEGLYFADRNIIPDGTLFLIGDRPARYEHLLVQLNSDVSENSHLRPLDKQRLIKYTDIYVNCYQTGMHISQDYYYRIRVGQLYINHGGGELFH